MRFRSHLPIIIAMILFGSVMLGGAACPAYAQDSSVERGAIYGGAAGLLFGRGLGGVLTGAAIGAGVGAVAPRTSPVGRGALYGGTAGLVFGRGLGDALLGAAIGGAAGGLLGR